MRTHFLVFLFSFFILSKAGATACPIGTLYFQGDSASFISQVVPNAMASGETYTVSVTFCNSGTSTWKYQSPPNGGNYADTTTYYRLGSLDPVNNSNWGKQRIDLSPGDNIAPGFTKTFVFDVTSPVNATGNGISYNFQWGMLRERVKWLGITPNILVSSFYTPSITLQNAPKLPPVSVSPTTFNFNNFQGADILYESYTQAGNNREWIPNAGQMTTIASQAVAMGLKYLRLPIVIPPDATGSEYIASEWYTPKEGLSANETNVNAVVHATQTALNIANADGLKVILVLDGYTEYDTACNSANQSGLKFWKKSFNAVKSNAATIIREVSNYSALFAWDIMNEPLWNASVYGCLNVSPNTFDRGTQLPLLSLAQSSTAYGQSVIEVVEAVHAMYNLVRENDAHSHPTTVGEGQLPYLHYWNDISSFASPHLYISAQDIINAQIQANGAQQYLGQAVQFSGAPFSPSQWRMTDQLIQTQVPLIASATINQMKTEVTINGVQLPLIIGEYGVSYPNQVLTQTDQATYYSLYLFNTSGGLKALNIGNMFWNLSTGAQENPSFSLLTATGTLLPAACVIAKGLGATPTGC
jgi:hypothetical protein